MGRDKVLATIKAEVPYTDPDWIKVFSLFEEMRQADMYASGLVAMLNKRAELLFSNQRAAIAFNGSWCVNVYREMNPDLSYASMGIPEVSQSYPISLWGGAGVHCMVNASCEKKEQAVAFLQWLSDTPQQVYLSQETHNLPANRYAVDQIPEVLQQFADDMEYINHPRFLPVNESSEVIEAMDKGIQAIIIGERSPEEIAQEVQQVKKRIMNK